MEMIVYRSVQCIFSKAIYRHRPLDCFFPSSRKRMHTTVTFLMQTTIHLDASIFVCGILHKHTNFTFELRKMLINRLLFRQSMLLAHFFVFRLLELLIGQSRIAQHATPCQRPGCIILCDISEKINMFQFNSIQFGCSRSWLFVVEKWKRRKKVKDKVENFHTENGSRDCFLALCVCV